MNAGKSAREPPFLTEQKTMAVDEISGLPKAMAVQMALRTLSPQFILLDELGGTEEVRALEQGMFSGAAVIATSPCLQLGRSILPPTAAGVPKPAGRCRLPCCFVAGIIRVRLPRCGYYDGFTAGGYILFGGVRLGAQGMPSASARRSIWKRSGKPLRSWRRSSRRSHSAGLT